MNNRYARKIVAGVAVAGLLAANSEAMAAQICFNAFGGTLHFQLQGDLTVPTIGIPISGRVFAPTNGPGCTFPVFQYPIVGSATLTSAGVIRAGFHEFNTGDSDVQATCGGIDYLIDTSTGQINMYDVREAHFTSAKDLKGEACTPPE